MLFYLREGDTVKTLSVIFGVIGLLSLIFSIELGVVFLCIGALCFVVANRKQRESLEERRHREIVEAMKGKQ